MTTSGHSERFSELVLPHLDSAYNLARWLTRDAHAAEDVVQEASLRALRFLGTLRSAEAGGWFLRVVRNAAMDYLSRCPSMGAPSDSVECPDPGPALSAERIDEAERVRRAIECLAPEFREVIVLKELEGRSYKEIAQIIGAPIGTVMSRLSRARDRLQALLADEPEEALHEL